MAYQITKEDVWSGEVVDRPGGLANKLESFRNAGVDLGFMIARRALAKPGSTVVFLSSLNGPDAEHAVEQQGFRKWTTATSLRIEGRDRPGLGFQIARTMGVAGVNMRRISAVRLSGQVAFHIALDSGADADKAKTALNKSLNG